MKSFFVPVFDFILRFTCYNCWQRTIAMILIIDGWLSVLCSEQDTICFHAQLMSIYAVIFFLQCFIFFSLVTKGFGVDIVAAVQSLHRRPGWAAFKVCSFLRGDPPNLGSNDASASLKQPATFTCNACSCFVFNEKLKQFSLPLSGQ